MRGWGIFLALVLTISPLVVNADTVSSEEVSQILIWKVNPDGYNMTETVVLKNVGMTDVDLFGWTLTDNEGIRTFGNCTIFANTEFVTSESKADYHFLTNEWPDMVYSEGWLNSSGTFKLANDGDEVLLLNNENSVIDAFVYGNSQYSGNGWTGESAPKKSKGVYQTREGARVLDGGVIDTQWQDTNTWLDWDTSVVHKLGASELEKGNFNATGAQLFLMPDSGRNCLFDALDGAQESIDIHVYEMTSKDVVEHIESACKRGVLVRILVEGSPVGGMSQASKAAAKYAQDVGASVRIVTRENDAWTMRRYAFVHCKYIVIDGDRFLILSENLKDSGFPQEGKAGNRGWGALVNSFEGAQWLTDLFQTDWDAHDSIDYPGWEGTFSYTSSGDWDKGYEPANAGMCSIELYATPDCTLMDDPIISTIDSATDSLLVQQFYIYKWWGSWYDSEISHPNPYLESVIDAGRRGVKVRVILDATNYNVEYSDYRDNDNTIAYINEISAREGLDMKAILIPEVHGFTKVHNKGLIADNDTVMISSINWNENSPCANRETALVIHSEDAGLYYADAFWRDWKCDFQNPVSVIQCKDNAMVNEILVLSAAGSSDDVGISNYSWDMDEDGIADCFGYSSRWSFSSSGSHTVTLTVYDEAGNFTSSSVVVNVSQNEEGMSPWIILAALLVVGAIAGFFILKR